eukprot:tig00000903_g5502.t1
MTPNTRARSRLGYSCEVVLEGASEGAGSRSENLVGTPVLGGSDASRVDSPTGTNVSAPSGSSRGAASSSPSGSSGTESPLEVTRKLGFSPAVSAPSPSTCTANAAPLIVKRQKMRFYIPAIPLRLKALLCAAAPDESVPERLEFAHWSRPRPCAVRRTYGHTLKIE